MTMDKWNRGRLSVYHLSTSCTYILDFSLARLGCTLSILSLSLLKGRRLRVFERVFAPGKLTDRKSPRASVTERLKCECQTRTARVLIQLLSPDPVVWQKLPHGTNDTKNGSNDDEHPIQDSLPLRNLAVEHLQMKANWEYDAYQEPEEPAEQR